MGKRKNEDGNAIAVLKSLPEALACGVACMGMFNLMDRYENGATDAQELGVKQILAGANMATFGLPDDVGTCFMK